MGRKKLKLEITSSILFTESRERKMFFYFFDFFRKSVK
jgi:hypothetical protein